MSPVADVNLVCVTDHWEATYSGMLPGVLAGDYSADQMTIDLVQLLSVAGVTWFNDELMVNVAIEPPGRTERPEEA